MDIDSPPSVPDHPHTGHNHLINLPSFSASFPLPFRVLFLVGLAQLLWAANLHILHILGLDTAWILDFRNRGEVEEIPLESTADSLDVPPLSNVARFGGESIESGKAYQPVYRLFLLYTAWVGGGWLVYRMLTGGEAELMESWRWFVGVIVVGAIVGALAPWRGTGQRERAALRSAVKRILLPPSDAPVFFCDVILADILTSFAKVLGDLWISACQIVNGGITQGRVRQNGWANYITLAMVCLPYVVRFRQCMLETHQSGWSNPRPFANSLKYFSAFPVIFLSAAQKNVVVDIAAAKGVTPQEIAESGDRWFGEHPMFRLWLLAVIINSMFSFWWDVQMDWGLKLCEAETWFGKKDTESPISARRRGSESTVVGRMRRFWKRGNSISHQRSPCPTPSPSFASSMSLSPPPASGFFAFGLRPILLLPDPLVYHLFTIIDLVLRFTWSLKLSSHLHTISEIESGVFMMEALELFRRWMWVFVRVEWEAVKMSEAKGWRGKDRGTTLWEVQDKGNGILGPEEI